MPTYALVHFPEIDKAKINELRYEYDPHKDLIDVHITVVFSAQVDQDALVRHIEEILTGWTPFTVRLKGLFLSEPTIV